MVFLLLAICSSAMISIFMRLSSGRVSANFSMLAVNYTVCSLLGGVYAILAPAAPAGTSVSMPVWLGIISGGFYLGGFVLFQRNTHKSGIVLSSVFMKLGLLVPVAMSLVVFREIPTVSQIIGFCVALLAIVVLNLKKESTQKGFGLGLIAMLLLCGGSDAMSKVYERLAPAAYSDLYLLLTFSVALVLCGLLVLYKKEKPGVKELLFGTLVGIPNFFSAKFLLRALTRLPAVVVYPSFSVATMLVATLAGVLVFRERLDKRQWLALGAILVALVLLNI